MTVPRHEDSRGWIMESFRQDELEPDCFPVMGYLSLTQPGMARGPHEHRDQASLFLFAGPGLFRIYLWDNRPESETYRNRMVMEAGEGNALQILVPPGVVQAFRNISDLPALVHNFPSQLYGGEMKRERVDEVRHEEDPASPFALD